jgi:peptidoglycan/LPS O-acetylase OafA/YrhL
MTGTTTPDERWRLGYRPALDGLRGVAIATVVASHLHVPFTAGGGSVGVTLFFVLSGFLISSLLLEEHRRTGTVSLVAFYRRRALRLLPAFLVMLALIVTFAGFVGAFGEMVTAALPPLFYVANIVPHGDGQLGPFGHTWTLSVEEQFYLVWPLVVLAILARPSRTRVILAGALAAAASFLQPTAAPALLAGCGIAALFARGAGIGIARPLAWAALGLLIVALAMPGPITWAPALLVLVVAPAIVLVAFAALSGGALGMLLSLWPLVALGKVSYGLYLWHVPVLWFARVALGRDALTPVETILFAVLSLGLAVASYALLEQPLLRRFRPSRRGDPHERGHHGTQSPSARLDRSGAG